MTKDRKNSRVADLPFVPVELNYDYITPIGMDLQTGVRDINLAQQAYNIPLVEPAQPSDPVEPPDYKAPTLDDAVASSIRYQQELNPILADRQRQAADIALQQSRAQVASLFPYLDAAGQRATERNLRASERFRAFKEQLPSSIQDIMSKKQAQIASAANAFATEAQAIAMQQQAATGFAQSGTNRYAGRRIA
jgi:hypothetical protein